MEIDAFLCDSIASAEGKIYAQGMGWNGIFAPMFPARHARIGIGVIIHVPYTATNQAHTFELRLETEDGGRVPLGDAPPGAPGAEDGKLFAIGGEFNMGRPPLLPPGTEQIVPLAMNFDGLTFQQPGAYSFVLAIDNTDVKRLPLQLQQLSQPGGMLRPQ